MRKEILVLKFIRMGGGVLFGILVLAMSCPAMGQEETCVPREEVVEMLADGLSSDEIVALLPPDCFENGVIPVNQTIDFWSWKEDEGNDAIVSAAKSSISIVNNGSVYWEAIDSCGYHPQRREMTCDVEVRQRNGYAGTPPGTPPWNGPGSFEWVLFCADFGTGMRPVQISAVHVHDEPYGNLPNWYYAVTVQANARLHQTLVDGRTMNARAVLSWAIIPTSCNYRPIWGNSADFQIKLDP